VKHTENLTNRKKERKKKPLTTTNKDGVFTPAIFPKKSNPGPPGYVAGVLNTQLPYSVIAIRQKVYCKHNNNNKQGCGICSSNFPKKAEPRTSMI
jgi:hypothetical protein